MQDKRQNGIFRNILACHLTSHYTTTGNKPLIMEAWSSRGELSLVSEKDYLPLETGKAFLLAAHFQGYGLTVSQRKARPPGLMNVWPRMVQYAI